MNIKIICEKDIIGEKNIIDEEDINELKESSSECHEYRDFYCCCCYCCHYDTCLILLNFIFWIFIMAILIVITYFYMIYVGFMSTITTLNNNDILTGNFIFNETIFNTSSVCNLGSASSIFGICFIRGLYTSILVFSPFVLVLIIISLCAGVFYGICIREEIKEKNNKSTEFDISADENNNE